MQYCILQAIRSFCRRHLRGGARGTEFPIWGKLTAGYLESSTSSSEPRQCLSFLYLHVEAGTPKFPVTPALPEESDILFRQHAQLLTTGISASWTKQRSYWVSLWEDSQCLLQEQREIWVSAPQDRSKVRQERRATGRLPFASWALSNCLQASAAF